MYLKRKEALELVREISESLLSDFESKSRFITDLLDQDDWSFVIKGHAILEAAVTEMVVEQLGESRLKPIIERLPLSDGQTGKIVIAKHLDLLSDEQRKFIRWFSELRNPLVHRLENVGFTFERYISGMDKNQKQSWNESIIWFAEGEVSRKEWKSTAEKTPKLAIYMGLLQIVCGCGIKSQQVKGQRKMMQAAQKTTGDLLKRVRSGAKKI
jgi:hypothetical protein